MGFWSRVKSTYSRITTRKTAPAPAPAQVSYAGSSGQPVSSTSTAPSGSTSTAGSAGQPVSTISGGGSSVPAPAPAPAQVSYAGSSGQPVSTLSTQEIQNLSSGGTTQAQMKLDTSSRKTDQPFYTSTKRETPTQYGALFVTEREAQKLKGSSLSYWEIKSKTMDEGLKEASFAQNIPYISQSGIRSRGVYEYNTQNIIAGKKVYGQYQTISKNLKDDPKSFVGQEGVITKSEGGQISEVTLTPSYFDKNIDTENIYQTSKGEATTQFKNLPKETRRKLNLGGYATGVASASLGIVEFTGTIATNLGQQKIQEGDSFGKSKKFYLGGEAGNIRSYPSKAPGYVGQATVIVPLVAQGVRSLATNIKTFGLKGGVAETASGFSPLRIKSGIYAEGITSKTTFKDVKSFKVTDKAGTTTRIYSGSSGGIKLRGIEKSAIVGGKKVGRGYTITETPYTEIRAGGSIIKSGIRTTVNLYTFKTTGAGSVYGAKANQLFTQQLTPSIKGGTSEILTSKGITTYRSSEGATTYSSFNKLFRSTGGGGSQKITEGVTRFTSGKATPIYKTTYGDTRINLKAGTTYKGFRGDYTVGGKATTSRDFIYEPSGKYKLTPKVSGVEYDLNALFGKAGSSSYKISSGGGAKTVTKFSGSGISASVVPAIKPVSYGSPVTLPPPQTKGLKTETLPAQIKAVNIIEPQVKVKTKVEAKEIGATINAVIPQVRGRSSTGQRSRSQGATTIIPKIETGIKPRSRSETATRVIQVQKIKLDTVQKSALSSGYGGVPTGLTYNFPTTPPVPVPFVMPLLSGFPSGALGIGRVKARKSETRYTPSFSALFFKLKGKAPKGKPTGLRFRPITPNFSFFKKRKVKRIRRVKRK